MSASQELYITKNGKENIIALMEEGELTEVYFFDPKKRNLSGNIYKGKVSKVIKGINAAFVDIGFEKAGFLAAKDTHGYAERKKPNSKNEPSITQFLRPGDEILVQVIREPFKGKGPKLTMDVTIPGRSIVLTPFSNNVSVSRKIESREEQSRLQDLLKLIKPESMGLIARTASEGMTEDDLEIDLGGLIEKWAMIRQEVTLNRAPSILHHDIEEPQKVCRDLYSSRVKSIHIDDDGSQENLYGFLTKNIPAAARKLVSNHEEDTLYEQMNFSTMLEKAIEKNVVLDSGIELVFDETEALISIDVNTAGYLGSRGQEETILTTNLQAIPEIVRQVRLRNLSGIIVVDFIDMKDSADKDKIYQNLKEEFKKDRAVVSMLPVSEFGLMEITRKRTASSLLQKLTHKCGTCDGVGRVKDKKKEEQ